MLQNFYYSFHKSVPVSTFTIIYRSSPVCERDPLAPKNKIKYTGWLVLRLCRFVLVKSSFVSLGVKDITLLFNRSFRVHPPSNTKMAQNRSKHATKCSGGRERFLRRLHHPDAHSRP